MNRRHALNEAARQLAEAGVPDARLDAELMLCDVLGLPRLMMLIEADRPLCEEHLNEFSAYVTRRATGEPLQYVLSEAHFMGHAFYVDKRVLIPRADTEPLCEAAISRLQPGRSMLDIGTGSGAIAVSLALAQRDAHITAVDISEDALFVARKNAKMLGASVDFLKSDLYAALSGKMFDMIVSNPPYIPEADIQTLQREVKWEPELALVGGADGFSIYKRILEGCATHLKKGGSLLLEAGDGQAQTLAEWMRKVFHQTTIQRDLSGLDRVLIGDGYAG